MKIINMCLILFLERACLQMNDGAPWECAVTLAPEHA